MVAAWMRADTGVGPAMASPSQAWSGNWADLPQAASSRKKPMAVSHPVLSAPSEAAGSTEMKATEPTRETIAIMASSRPTSPTRFMMKAFLAAVAFSRLASRSAAGASASAVFQKPMSR